MLDVLTGELHVRPQLIHHPLLFFVKLRAGLRLGLPGRALSRLADECARFVVHLYDDPVGQVVALLVVTDDVLLAASLTERVSMILGIRERSELIARMSVFCAGFGASLLANSWLPK